MLSLTILAGNALQIAIGGAALGLFAAILAIQIGA